jgi:hypothetical protein
MLRVERRALGALMACFFVAGAAGAQQPAAPTGPGVGDLAPDFSLGGATRYGQLRDPVTLSSYRGNTVVLAFFFKARTRG